MFEVEFTEMYKRKWPKIRLLLAELYPEEYEIWLKNLKVVCGDETGVYLCCENDEKGVDAYFVDVHCREMLKGLMEKIFFRKIDVKIIRDNVSWLETWEKNGEKELMQTPEQIQMVIRLQERMDALLSDPNMDIPMEEPVDIDFDAIFKARSDLEEEYEEDEEDAWAEYEDEEEEDEEDTEELEYVDFSDDDEPDLSEVFN